MLRHHKKLWFVFACLVLLRVSLPAQTPQRYFDTAVIPHPEVRLVVCYPSVGTIRAVVALRKAGVLNVKDLTVIGVYHSRELTNYEESKNYVKANELGWFKFHEISADIKESELFKKNAFTLEFETIFKSSDGIIFFGGPDIPASIFNQKNQPVDPDRRSLSPLYGAILHLSFAGRVPGSQCQGPSRDPPQLSGFGDLPGLPNDNVGTGGTLFQDLWSDVYHKMFVEDIIALGQEYWHKNPYLLLHPEEKLSYYSWHSIKFDGTSKFRQFVSLKTGDRPYVSSSHHQAVDQLGKDLWISATSLDGKIAEVIEHKTFPNVLGVQFHPERFSIWEGAPKFRFSPQDKEAVTLMSFLEGHPPSLEFHKKIWAWLSQRLQEYHAAH